MKHRDATTGPAKSPKKLISTVLQGNYRIVQFIQGTELQIEAGNAHEDEIFSFLTLLSKVKDTALKHIQH